MAMYLKSLAFVLISRFVLTACVSDQSPQNPTQLPKVLPDIQTNPPTSISFVTPTLTANIQVQVEKLFTQTAQAEQRLAPTETLIAAFSQALAATADEGFKREQMTYEIVALTLTPRATPSSTPISLLAVSDQVKKDIKAQLPALFNIVDDVTATHGASTLLVQYWEDVQTSGSTQGCSTTVIPPIPNNVFIAEADLQASPDLRDAVQLINNGLSALRTDWTNFQFACNSNGLQAKLASELANARVANDSFVAAGIKLQLVQAAL